MVESGALEAGNQTINFISGIFLWLQNAVSVEFLITVLMVLISWIALTINSQVSTTEFEQRLRNVFGPSEGATKTYTKNADERVGVKIKNVYFEERRNLWDLIKRTSWPWQGIEGTAKFNLETKNMRIPDLAAFRKSAPEWASIRECTNEQHDNHYYADLDTTQPDIADAFEREGVYGFEVFFHYFANSTQIEILV